MKEASRLLSEGLKVCAECGETKPLEGFVRDTQRSSGYRSYCIPCHRTRSRAQYAANPQPTRERMLLRKYGITEAEYLTMLVLQDSQCAICGGGPNGNGAFHVDHNHETGQVRGLLCVNCNVALGNAQEDPSLLRRMATYLEVNGLG